MRRIAIINQKGGVGKTTTTVNVGAALARAGHRVLMVDLDPQAHLTLHLGLDPRASRAGTYEMLTGSATIAKARTRVANNLWVVGSSIDLAAAEVELVSVVGREVILRDLIEQHTGGSFADGGMRYDYLLMDCPPSLSVLTLNGLCAAHEVIIPLQPHYLALQGLGKLLETVALVSKRINPQLAVSGVVICMREQGTKLAAEVIDDVRSFLAEAQGTDVPWSAARVFETMIRRNIKLAESPSYGQSIFDYAPDSKGAQDYQQLGLEIHDPAALVMPSAPAEISEFEEPSAVDEQPVMNEHPAMAEPAAIVEDQPIVEAEVVVEAPASVEQHTVVPESPPEAEQEQDLESLPDAESVPGADVVATEDSGEMADDGLEPSVPEAVLEESMPAGEQCAEEPEPEPICEETSSADDEPVPPHAIDGPIHLEVYRERQTA